VLAVIRNSGGELDQDKRTVDFLQDSRQAPTSDRVHNESKPDGYLVPKDRKKVERDEEKENLRWADVALSMSVFPLVLTSCEYKRKDGHCDLGDVRVHLRLKYPVLGLLLILGRAKVPVELATRHARRSTSSRLIWHDH
jgi:hypothetical protein